MSKPMSKMFCHLSFFVEPQTHRLAAFSRTVFATASLLGVLLAGFDAAAAAPANDDDDILAPADDADDKAAVKSGTAIGIVPLVPLGETPESIAAKVTKKITREFEDGASPMVPLKVASGKSKKKSAADPKAVEMARKKTKIARKQLRAGVYGRAMTGYKEALAAYAVAGPGLENINDLVQVYIDQAEVFARQGLDDEQGKALTSAALLNPEFALDQEKYPPQFLEDFKNAVVRVKGGGKGSIVVDETAGGAEIFIDGRSVGNAPLRIKDIPAGRHHLRVEHKEHGRYGKFVVVKAKKTAKVSPKLTGGAGTGPLASLRGNALSKDAAKAFAAMAKKKKLEGVVVGVVSQSKAEIKTRLLYIDSKTAAVHSVEPLLFDGDLLNMSIEALKARESIAKVQQDKSQAKNIRGALLADAVAAKNAPVKEVSLRFAEGVTSAPGKAAKKTSTKEKRSRRVGEPGDSDERKIASSGKSRRKDVFGSGTRDRLGSKRKEVEPIIEDEDEGLFGTTGMIIGAVGIGVAAVVVVAAGVVGGGAAYYFLTPPSTATVDITIPE